MVSWGRQQVAGLVDGTGTGVPGTARLRNTWLKINRICQVTQVSKAEEIEVQLGHIQGGAA